jgi:hypothetical protein
MTDRDPVLHALAALRAAAPPSAELSRKLRAAAHARLVPVKVHPGWGVAIAASVVAYLGWALLYTSQL